MSTQLHQPTDQTEPQTLSTDGPDNAQSGCTSSADPFVRRDFEPLYELEATDYIRVVINLIHWSARMVEALEESGDQDKASKVAMVLSDVLTDYVLMWPRSLIYSTEDGK